jgi:hypothetical protein
MAFKIGENVAGRGKLYPVFVAYNGEMYSVRMSQEQLDMFQSMVHDVVGGEVLLDTEPLNNGCTYRIGDK